MLQEIIKRVMKLALVGSTGLVGQKMLDVLQERKVRVSELIPIASSQSVGKKIKFRDAEYEVVDAAMGLAMKPDVALFSAGGSVSLEWAPKFAQIGTFVIDNSSAWRMDENVPLIVPEINSNSISSETRIIANPNCSTIQMVMALSPLHEALRIKRLVISTYQSVTGTGKKALDQMMGERNGNTNGRVYPHQIDMNCLPHCDVFTENGYTKEEMKLVHETRKILAAPQLAITATAVRVPVMGGHSESVNAEFERDFGLDQIRTLLEETDGVTLIDNPSNNEYPMPLAAHEKNDVFVGRIRWDESQPNTINLWVVSDNLRKGAATNAVQILEHLVTSELVGVASV